MLRFINRQGTDTYTDVKILEILLAAKEGNWESARDKCALLRELAIDEQTKQRVEELISAVDGRDFGQLSQSTFYREAIERYPDEVKSHLRNLRVGMVVIVIILTYVVYKTII